MLASRAWNAFKSRPRIQRWGDYWTRIYKDYREVAVDTVKDAKEKPRKTAAILSALGVIGTAFRTNPCELQYRQEVVAGGSRLALTSESTRNPVSSEYIRTLYRYENEGLLRYVNLGFFSIVWRANFDPSTDVYLAQCPYLQPGYLEILRERIVDFGAFGRWFLINKAMVDYDVNDELWDKVDMKLGA